MSQTLQGRVQFVPLLLEKKPTLQSLRRKCNIPANTLADAAGVSLTDSYLVEIGVPVQKALAVKVLKAFSELTRKEYSFDDISVAVKED